MSDRKVLHIDKLRRFARGPKPDLRLQLLAVKDLASLFLEELDRAFDHEETAIGPQGTLTKLYSGAGINYYQELRQFEIELIRCALAVSGGKQMAAAKLLGLKPTTLNTKIKQFNIEIKKGATQKQPAFHHSEER